MIDEIFASRAKILREEYGFEDSPDSDEITAFHAPSIALDTKMIVQGDHADDCAYIFYSRPEVDGKTLDGLFYAPSIFEYLVYRKGEGWSPKPILEKINRYTDCEIELKPVGGLMMLFCEIPDVDWQYKDIRFEISDMLKAVGQLDYFLQEEDDE